MIDRRPTANFLGYTIWIAGKLKQSNNNQRRSLPSITFSSRSQKTATTTMKSRIRGELFYKKEIRNCPLWTDDDDVSLVVVVMMMKEKCFLLSFFTAKKSLPALLCSPRPLTIVISMRRTRLNTFHSSFFFFHDPWMISVKSFKVENRVDNDGGGKSRCELQNSILFHLEAATAAVLRPQVDIVGRSVGLTLQAVIWTHKSSGKARQNKITSVCWALDRYVWL